LDIFISNLLACSVAFRALAVDLGFRPLTVGRISTLYLDIAYRQYMQAYYYSKTQGEERQILANQIVNKYDDDAKILIEQAEQATQEAVRYGFHPRC
jgi:hypothetical protein